MSPHLALPSSLPNAGHEQQRPSNHSYFSKTKFAFNVLQALLFSVVNWLALLLLLALGFPLLTKMSPSAPESLPSPPQIYNIRIYTITVISCLGSWMFGYNNGVIAGVLVLPSFHRDFHLPEINTPSYNNTTANIVSILQIGGLIGSAVTFYCMKTWGRRPCLSGAGLVYAVGAVLQTFSHGNLAMMYVGRLVAGLGTGSATVVIPLYIAELSPPSIRGRLVGFYEINNQISSVLGYWCNYIVNEYIPPTQSRQWQIALAMQIIPSSLLFLCSVLVLPESPRYLVQKGKLEEARKVLAQARKLNAEHEYICNEMAEIEGAIRRQSNSEDENLRGLRRFIGLCKELSWRGNRNRVLIGVGLMVGQNLTGINGVNFYTPTIFRSIGFGGTTVGLLASGMFAVVKAIATILSLVFLIDRAGRRWLLITSSLGIAISLYYIGGFVIAANVNLSIPQPKTAAGWVAIVCVYVYAASFSIAWNGVVWIYCAEIFPARIKDLAICLTTCVQWLGQFAVARATPTMISSMGGGFFLFFAGCITVMLAFVFFLVPETKSRTLEGMDEIFGTPYGEPRAEELGTWRSENVNGASEGQVDKTADERRPSAGVVGMTV